MENEKLEQQPQTENAAAPQENNQTGFIQLSECLKVTINHSHIDKALAEAQVEMDNVTKDSKGYNYKYADLGSIIETSKETLGKHGINVMQASDFKPEKKAINMTTVLTHGESGEMYVHIIKDVPLPAGPSIIQNLGSAITYTRRYAMQPFLNIAALDDDGSGTSINNNDNINKGKNQNAGTKPNTGFNTTPTYNKPANNPAANTPGIQRPQPVTATAKPVAQHKCTECNAAIEDNVYDYAIRNFQKSLCISCQNKLRASNTSNAG